MVVSDASSCTEGFAHSSSESGVASKDAVAFAARGCSCLGSTSRAVVEQLVLHPTCSSRQMGLDPALRAGRQTPWPSTCTSRTTWGCCAFAGDRGMLHPELTASATKAEAAEVAALGADAHASCNRTCELGMTRATGEDYRHVLELLEEATRP